MELEFLPVPSSFDRNDSCLAISQTTILFEKNKTLINVHMVSAKGIAHSRPYPGAHES